MQESRTLQVTTPSEREIAMTRTFDAPRRLIFDAHTKPELVRRWLLGPPGWTMPVCEIDLRVGGRYRYVWRKEQNGTEMGMGGVYREIVAPERLVATERFDESWYPGEALDTLALVERDGGTTLTQTVLYESREARDAALASGMEQGVAAGYDRLEELLPALARGEKVMLDTPQITQTTAQQTAVIHLTIPREEIRNVMGPGIGELMAAVAAQGIAPAGPWFSHHLRMDPGIFDFEIGVPVTAPVVAAGRMKPGHLPATKVARTVYRGGYEGLGAAWGEFDAWIAAQGHTPGPDLWECYVAGPESSPDPANWRTELNRPLAG